jgi:hypothetical protein
MASLVKEIQANKPAAAQKTTKETKPKQEPPPPPTCPEINSVPLHYEIPTKTFYGLNISGHFQPLSETAMKLMLRRRGFSETAKHPNGLTYLEEEQLRITLENGVYYAGPLGGYPVGIHEINGQQCLATRPATKMEPVKGEWNTFKQFLRELLGPETKYFCAWMKSALDSLEAGSPWSPGQLLAIAGPGDSGKSFLQTLITPMLGKRVSSPYKYMAGGSDFNSEIYGAEHGLIGDQNHKFDKNSRRAFGAAIKDLVVNPEQYVRGMYKGATTLSTFFRLTITLNDNAQALLVLPEMDSDVADKIMLLHAHPVAFPFPSPRYPTKHVYYTKLLSELPCFLWHLRRWQIPDKIGHQRYGVVSYKSPSLIEKMNSLSSEWKLWNLVEMYVFKDRDCTSWEGTASELEKLIRDECKGENLHQLFFYPGACGSYLTSLAPKLDGAIVIKEIGGNRHFYTLTRKVLPPKR